MISQPVPILPADNDHLVNNIPPESRTPAFAHMGNETPPFAIPGTAQEPNTPGPQVQNEQPPSVAVPHETHDHSHAPQNTRPRRERKQRKLYRADTGTWEVPQ